MKMLISTIVCLITMGTCVLMPAAYTTVNAPEIVSTEPQFLMASPDEVATPDEVQPKEMILGDIDLDGKVNDSDSTLIQRYIANFTKLNKNQKKCANINQKEISIMDATEIQKYLAKNTNNVYVGKELGYEPPKPTEPPTEATETKKQVAETKSENVIYTQIDHGTVGQGKPQNATYTYEADLLARTIYCEAGNCSEYCQWLVGSTVLNLADERGGIESVVFDYNTFNVAYILYDKTPSKLSYSVAQRLLSGDRDYNVKAFRMSYYHNFGSPYTSVDGVYFSTY